MMEKKSKISKELGNPSTTTSTSVVEVPPDPDASNKAPKIAFFAHGDLDTSAKSATNTTEDMALSSSEAASCSGGDGDGAGSRRHIKMLQDSSPLHLQHQHHHHHQVDENPADHSSNFEDIARDIMASIEPLPPPTRHSSGGSSASTPGAFLTDPLGREREARPVPFSLLTSNNVDDDQSQQQEVDTAQHATRRHQDRVMNGIVGLPATTGEHLSVANLIDDDDDPVQLPQAEEYDPETNSRTSVKSSGGLTNSTDQSQLFCFILVALGLVAIIVVTLAVTIGNHTDDSDISQFPYDGEEGVLGGSPFQGPHDSSNTAGNQIMSLLPSDTVELIQHSESSPQAMAFSWLENDPFLDEYIHFPARIIQRFALATLYFSSNGPEWRQRTNWMSYFHHECTWFSHTSFAMRDILGSTAMPGYLEDFHYGDQPCNATYHKDLYQNLWLDQNGLKGTIPTELYLLTHLKTLSLGLNFLRGTISTHVGQLTNLEGLAYFYMPAGGHIPSEVGLLTKLRCIGFAHNQHTGSIPREYSKLTNLETLFVSGNPLSGSLPNMELYRNIRWINFDENGLKGTIPAELGQLDKLEFVAFGGNRFSGSVPSELGLLTRMLMMSFYSNELTGNLPTQLGELTSSTLISFRGNKLSGSIPSQLGRVTNLISLNLQQNALGGDFPSQLGNLASLYELSVMENKLSGYLPSQLGRLTSLGRFSAQYNALVGKIPVEMTDLLASGLLYTFDVAGTSLSGTVPEAFCGLDGTCKSSSLNPCEDRKGLTFDCSDILCGCDCPCSEESNSTKL